MLTSSDRNDGYNLILNNLTSILLHFLRVQDNAWVSSKQTQSSCSRGEQLLILIGHSLAYAELRITTAKLFRRFKFSLDPTMTDKDLHQLDCFTTAFEGTGLRVRIECERD
jgi:hypothetical protein